MRTHISICYISVVDVVAVCCDIALFTEFHDVQCMYVY